VLSPTAIVLYKCDQFHHKESEGGIRYDDTLLNIDWKIEKDKEIIAEKDLALPPFSHYKKHV
jgi:dTDP-4-dehydrorhamnose 3,5-epimerase